LENLKANLVDLVDVPHSKLIVKLAEHGWSVVHRERNDIDWWADEIWTVESEWAPRGLNVYLTWLVDPQWDDYRKRGKRFGQSEPACNGQRTAKKLRASC
jgi:hypothetical protein